MKNSYWFRTAAGAALIVLSACGGGGGSDGNGGGGGGAPTNNVPQFTSSSNASVVENTSGVFYTVSASDADGDPLIYSLSGPDAAAFSLGSSGALSFATPPNFDLPTDANLDNVYQVTLGVSDGRGGTGSLALAIGVTNSREGITVKRIASGFSGAVALTSNLNGAQIVVGQQNGQVSIIEGSTGATVSSAYAFGLAPVGSSKLVGIARGFTKTPAYSGLFVLARATGGSFYMTRSSANLSSEATFTAASTIDATGVIGADGNGQIYVAIGDPSGNFAQDNAQGFGKLFRIDPNPDPFAGASPRYFTSAIVGKGMRQPAGIAVLDGMLIFSDRGGSKADELNRYPGAPLPNFGWPFQEGTSVLTSGGPNSLLPILEVPLGSGVRQSSGISGPAVYSGAIASLTGMVVAGDADGTIWAYPKSLYGSVNTVTGAMLEVRTQDFVPDVGTIDGPVAFATDANGTLYILDSDGELFRVDSG